MDRIKCCELRAGQDQVHYPHHGLPKARQHEGDDKGRSNVPRHVLKGMTCGMMKRYAIISDTLKKYHKEVRAMEAILTRQGWSKYAIARIHGKPRYQDRLRFIEEFMDEQRIRKMVFLNRHCTKHIGADDAKCNDGDDKFDDRCMFWMMQKEPVDRSVIVCVGEAFNICYDDRRLKERVEHCRKQLPAHLQRKEFILAQRGDVRVSAAIKSNGL